MSTVGTKEKKQVLISFIKKLLKSIKPIKVILHKNHLPVETYLHAIYVAEQEENYSKDKDMDIKKILKAALKSLKNSDNISNLTVRLLIGDTIDGIDKQIDYLKNSYSRIQIAF